MHFGTSQEAATRQSLLIRACRKVAFLRSPLCVVIMGMTKLASREQGGRLSAVEQMHQISRRPPRGLARGDFSEVQKAARATSSQKNQQAGEDREPARGICLTFAVKSKRHQQSTPSLLGHDQGTHIQLCCL